MKHCIANTAGITVGLDLGDKVSQVFVLTREGEVREDTKLPTKVKPFLEYFSRLERARVVLETGGHSAWVSRLLEKCGHETIVANSRQLEMISKNHKKSDRVDALLLAQLGRVSPALLSPVQHRSREAQVLVALLRAREALVKSRTAWINCVRGAVKALGARIPAGLSTRSFHEQVVDYIPKDLLPSVVPLLEALKETTVQIKEYDRKIEEAGGKPELNAQRVRQVQGVGPVTALAFVLMIGAPQRFKKSRTVGAYLGLVPRKHESGESSPELSITKRGDGLLRRLLVGSAQYILGPHAADCDLRRYGLAIAARGGKTAKKRAVVAVARKLAVLLHRLLVSGEPYEPLRKAERQEKKRSKVVKVPA